MKKIFLCIIFMFVSFFIFSLPNMKLYLDSEVTFEIKNDNLFDGEGSLIGKIENEKLYDSENGVSFGTVIENDKTISIILTSEDNSLYSFEFYKITGFIYKAANYENNIINNYMVFEYEKNKLIKTSYYGENDSFIGYEIYAYDKKMGIRTKVSGYNENDNLISQTEFDNKTGNKTSVSEFDEKGVLRVKTSYDKDTGDAISRLVYSQNPKKTEKWNFLKFDENGRYTLNDNYYLSTTFCSYKEVEEYAEESKITSINWNDKYSAVVSKIDYTNASDGYELLNNLNINRYLSERTVTLGRINSLIFYCFDTNEKDEIDLSSCYEIKLIKKNIDYSEMNKSGKGKGPFGFDIGMSYEDIKEACGGNEPEHIGDDRYYVKPKKTHPQFEKYIVWISDSVGLYYIKANSPTINTSGYGTEIKSQFNELLRTLEKKYGNFKITDTVKSDYSWTEEKYWMRSLKDGARKYRADWTSKNNYKDYDGISWVSIGIDKINEYSTDKAYIWIEYEFVNYEDAEEALNDVL